MRLRTALAAVTAAIAGGCGSSTASLSAECVRGTSPLATALRSAPDAVQLADGTRLSDCVSRADDDGEIQDVRSRGDDASPTSLPPRRRPARPPPSSSAT